MWKQVLLAQLCIILIWQTNAANPTVLRSAKPQPQKGLVTPSQDFISDMCRAMNDALQLVPWPLRYDGICSNVGLSNPENADGLCPLLDMVKLLLDNLQSLYPLQCVTDGILPPTASSESGKGLLLPAPLPSQLTAQGLPARFPPAIASMLLQAEGPSYYWLFKHVMRLMAWAPCGPLGQETPFTPPEGWDLLGLLSAPADLSSYGIKQTSMPFAAVIRRSSTSQTKASCKAALAAHPQFAQRRNSARMQRMSRTLCAGDEIVVLVRGTTAASDWFIDFDYALVPSPEFGAGLLHNGFQKLADALWTSGLKDLLDQYGGSTSSITITGHSLGAATAALLASRTQKYFDASTKRRALAPSPSVTAVLIASPNVGDATFAADYNSRVDTRNVGFLSDIVTQVPCVGNMVECVADPSAEPTSSLRSAGNVTVKFIQYERLGGVISLGAADMPVQQDAWGQLSVYTQDDFCTNFISVANQMEATHICSYMCALSATSPADSGDWCKLWADEGVKQTGTPTFCMAGYSFFSDTGDFPTSPQFPSLKTPEWLRQQPMRRGPQNRAKRTARGSRKP